MIPRQTRRIRLFVPALVLLALLMIVPVTIAQTPQYSPADCPLDVADNVECGYLIVPEDRSNPNSPDIWLAVAIVRSEGATLPDPIVYLEGGPGGSALTALDAWYNTVYGENRDIILIDQRGTGYSEPGLFCGEGGDSEVDETRACRNELEAQGIDLAAYTSAANAADVEDLRIALGYDQINLYGVSYGTRLAMTVMRDFPDGIRSVVLDSPFPPAADVFNEDGVNFYYGLTELAADCAANAACNAAFPDLERFFVDLVNRANENPLIIGDEEVFGTDLVEQLYQNFYDTKIIPFLPAIIYDTAAGSEDAYIAFEESLDSELFGDENGSDGVEDSAAVDLAAMTDAEFDAFMMDELDFDTVDELYDYLDGLTDDEYNALLTDIESGESEADFDESGDIEDSTAVDLAAMTDDEFNAFMMDELDFDTVDELYDYLDGLTDDEYNALLDEIEGGGEDDFDRTDAAGMFNSVTCAEEIPFSSLQQQAALMANIPPVLRDHFRESFEISQEVCAVWGVPLSGPLEDEIVVSDIPTLILVGQYDVATPPAWAALAAEGLSTVFLLEFPGAGHGIIDATPCAREIGADFMNNPSTGPDTTCLEQIGPPQFYVP